MKALQITSLLAIATCTSGFSQSQSKLPTPKEAMNQAYSQALSRGSKSPADEALKASDLACRAEVDAINAGHPQLVDDPDFAECQQKIQAEAEAKAQAEADAKQARLAAIQEQEKAAAKAQEQAMRKEIIQKQHCPATLRMGISEDCVFALFGLPAHENTTASFGTQWVYRDHEETRDVMYVYFNRKGALIDYQIFN